MEDKILTDILNKLNNLIFSKGTGFSNELLDEFKTEISEISTSKRNTLLISFMASKYVSEVSYNLENIKENSLKESTIEFFDFILASFDSYFYKNKVTNTLNEIDSALKSSSNYFYFISELNRSTETNQEFCLKYLHFRTVLINYRAFLWYSNKNNKLDIFVPITYLNEDIYLGVNEIVSGIVPVIRKHKTEGSYGNWEVYINTLFYLVREDCYRSLRECLFNITKSKKIDSNIEKIYTEIYFYDNVVIKDLEIENKGIIFTLIFNPISKRVNWTKRMIFGSLLVLTTKNFDDFFSVSVLERPDNHKIGRKKFNVIPFECKVKLVENSYKSFVNFMNYKNEEMFMFESKAFFEAYSHLMERLQKIKLNSLPFEDIIINYDPETNISMMPEYIKKYNYSLMYGNERFNVNNYIWSLDFVRMFDETQLNAFKHGVTNKVSLIQGPPGTGKTYLGGVLAKLLLQNTNRPVLIACYTNHALDQFLGHILKFEKQIIRIGGRSCDELKEFSLQKKREDFKFLRFKGKEYYDLNNRIKEIYGEIKSISSSLNHVSKFINENSILTYHEFCEFAPQTLVEKFYFDFVEATGIEYNEEEFIDLLYYIWINMINEEMSSSEIVDKFLNFDTMEVDREELIECLDNFFYDIEKHSNETGYRRQKVKAKDSNLISSDENFILSREEGYLKSEDDEEEEDEIEDQDAINENLNRRGLDQMDEFDKEMKKVDGENFRLSKEDFIYYTTKCNVWYVGKDIRTLIALYLKENYSPEGQDSKQSLYNHYYDLLNEKNDLDKLKDLIILRKAKVVGMTTTGCSKYSHFLENMNFEIVMVEEAAEVLESHIASLFTKNLKHLIMIGDHHQLRPNPFNHIISKKYNYEISMFERLINNNVPSVCLGFQRRMRPEFADFIRLIYSDNYKDHETTKHRYNVLGFTSNIFFLNHKELEDSNCLIASSKKNSYEANFICRLTEYIIQQGYESDHITIVVMYLGQQFLIKQILNNMGRTYSNIRVTTVDNYQGEENDFIIVSLVRSNKDNRIGFVKTMNRICVALSRAKLGLYVIGNIDCMMNGENKTEKLWTRIHNLAREKNVISDKITLSCINHSRKSLVKYDSDFDEIPNGGCNQICGMECEKGGHLCKLKCHNFPHGICEERCLMTCERCNKKCTKKCYQECGNCMNEIEKTLNCGHKQKAHCYLEINQIICRNDCSKLIENCGHQCRRFCHQNCLPCITEVEFKLDCGHVQKDYCHKNPKAIKCRSACNKTNPCGHNCKKLCHEECLSCDELVDITLNCGHKQKVKCGCIYINLVCNSKCLKLLKCGHPCQNKCAEICTEKCMKKFNKTLSCGHQINDYCYNESKCENQCTKTLRCGHKCEELCSVLCKCSGICNKTLRCGHKCQEQCSFPCLCKTLVERKLPCGHFQKEICSKPINQVICENMTEISKVCGHKVSVPCKLKYYSAICTVEENKLLPCGHSVNLKCNINPSQVTCTDPCKRVLPCGHLCDKLCYQTCQTSINCKAEVPRILKCGHKNKLKCYQSELNVKCNFSCKLKLPCGHFCQNKCSEKCSGCKKTILKRMKCGHNVRIACNDEINEVKCMNKCYRKLSCGHKCLQSCYIKCDRSKCNAIIYYTTESGDLIQKKCSENLNNSNLIEETDFDNYNDWEI